MEKIFSCEDVAERYGVKKLTVWAWIREKKLNAIQTGKSYRIRYLDLMEFEGARLTRKTV
ncbi:MAG: helix-turn-helix domain-containing protein [Pelosinus sp.]|nr:helix-turn-helix domain-containing protein [Pelosinus sp.]